MKYVYVLETTDKSFDENGECYDTHLRHTRYFSSMAKAKKYVDKVIDRYINRGCEVLIQDFDKGLNIYHVEMTDGEQALKDYGYETRTTYIVNRYIIN